MKLKVCGMRDPENIRELAALMPDYMGLIFYEPSPRYAAAADNREEIRQLPESIRRVGVFVDEPAEKILQIAEDFQLQAVQLHGNESPEICEQLAGKLEVYKAFSVGEDFDFNSCREYAPHCSLFVFDTKGKYYGGNGYKFNWDLLKQYRLNTPFLLSGGLSVEDGEKVKELFHPALIGVDINSGFESAKGVKNIAAIQEFKKALQ